MELLRDRKKDINNINLFQLKGEVVVYLSTNSGYFRMAEEELWEQFNLGENNPDPGGGILYCLRYSMDRLIEHRRIIIAALKKYGAEMEDLGEDIGVVLKMNTEESKEGIIYTLEELSVLNEAIGYKIRIDEGINSLEQLKCGFISAYFELLKERELAEAYDLVSMTIPMIVRDINTAHSQNNVLSEQEKKSLDELASFSEKQTEYLNNPLGKVIFGIN